MTRWIAFLRAINTGHRRVKGDRLVGIFESLGFEDVSTFQASGNVLFSGDSPDGYAIEQALVDALEYEVPTVLRSGTQVREIASTMPFDESELDASEGRAQVILIRDTVDPERLNVALAGAPPDEVLRGHGGDVFWLPRAGISDSSLDLSAMERALGPVTVRTHATMGRLTARL